MCEVKDSMEGRQSNVNTVERHTSISDMLANIIRKKKVLGAFYTTQRALAASEARLNSL